MKALVRLFLVMIVLTNVFPVRAQDVYPPPSSPHEYSAPAEYECSFKRYDPDDLAMDPIGEVVNFTVVDTWDFDKVFKSWPGTNGSLRDYIYVPGHWMYMLPTVAARVHGSGLLTIRLDAGLPEITQTFYVVEEPGMTVLGVELTPTEVSELYDGGSLYMAVEFVPANSSSYVEVNVFSLDYCYYPTWEYIFEVLLPSIFNFR